MRKPTICICENKGTDQLRSNCEADQRLCFCYLDSTIPLLFSHLLCIFSLSFFLFFFFFFFYCLLSRSISDHYLMSCGNMTCSRPQRKASRLRIEPGTSGTGVNHSTPTPDCSTVQLGLCRTCSETTLLTFPRRGSNHVPALSATFKLQKARV